MIPRFFGQYLLEKRIISPENLKDAIEFQSKQNLKIGELGIEMNYLTEDVVNEIFNEQQKTNKLFGEIAIEQGYLNKTKVKRLITIQKNNHIYLGQALVKLGILSKNEINIQLDNFKEDQKDAFSDNIEIPIKHPDKEYFQYFFTVFALMLIRIGGIQNKLGKINILEEKSESYYVNVKIDFSGDINLALILKLNENIIRKLAYKYFKEELKDEELIIAHAGEFANIVCGNISTKLQMLGLKTQISIPEMIIGKNTPNIKYDENETALSLEFVTSEGLCEAQLVLKNVEARVSNKKTVLIVDDSKSVAYKLQKIVEKLTDFEIVGHAMNGTDALKMYEELQPDLVTMDIVLPDLSGLDVTKKIIQSFPDANIVVISSIGGGQEQLFEAIQAGAKNVIVKPFDDDAVSEIFIQSV